MKLFFCQQINKKFFYKLIVSIWVCVARHVQSTQNNKFAMSLQYLMENIKGFFKLILSFQVTLITSLLFLRNILRKKSVRKLIFLHADEHQSFQMLTLLFLMEVTRHVQSTQNMMLVMFLQYLKEKLSQLLLSYIVMQNIQIFYGGPVMFVVVRCKMYKYTLKWKYKVEEQRQRFMKKINKLMGSSTKKVIHKQPPEFLKILQNSLRIHRPENCNFIQKETLAKMFFCEFCKILKSTFFKEHLQTTASGNTLFP